MTPPVAPVVGKKAEATASPPAVSVCLQVMRKRSIFLQAARAKRQATPGFMLQARQRGPNEIDHNCIRVGYTCTKKVGNAVARNRAKRRLRAIARQIMPEHGNLGWDYVLVGRAMATASRPFDELLGDLKKALERAHSVKS